MLLHFIFFFGGALVGFMVIPGMERYYKSKSEAPPKMRNRDEDWFA